MASLGRLEGITDIQAIRRDNAKKWKHDSDYIRYIESGESAAVFVVRDIASQINTKGKWTDIVSLSAHRLDKDGWAFNWIVAELFPRKLTPEYDTDDAEHNRYLTWKTANDDIRQQRSEGYSGPKYLLLCTLCDKNKGKTITFTLTKITKKYTSPAGEVREITQKATNPETITEPSPHDWEYKIKFIKRLNASQSEHIKSHAYEIEAKITDNGEPAPEIFGFKSGKGAKEKQ